MTWRNHLLYSIKGNNASFTRTTKIENDNFPLGQKRWIFSENTLIDTEVAEFTVINSISQQAMLPRCFMQENTS